MVNNVEDKVDQAQPQAKAQEKIESGHLLPEDNG
jgi:hypothetical protein